MLIPSNRIKTPEVNEPPSHRTRMPLIAQNSSPMIDLFNAVKS